MEKLEQTKKQSEIVICAAAKSRRRRRGWNSVQAVNRTEKNFYTEKQLEKITKKKNLIFFKSRLLSMIGYSMS